MSTWHGGKGSARRPPSVDDETIASNWDRIFKKPAAVPERMVERECADCGGEVTHKGSGDESLEYCAECDRIVEGQTKPRKDDDR